MVSRPSFHRARQRSAVVLLAFAASAGVVACSSDDGGSGATTTSTTKGGTTSPTSDVVNTTTSSGPTTSTTTPGTTTTTTAATTTTEGRDPGPSGGTRDRLVGVMADSFATSIDDPTARRCLGEHIVDAVGVDRFRADGGITPENFEGKNFDDLRFASAEANRIYDSFGQCDVDLKDAILGAGDYLDPATKACLDDKLNDDALRQGMVEMLMTGESTSLEKPMMECLDLGFDESGSAG